MVDPNKDTDNFVEIDGVKYEEDPEKEGEALTGEDGELVPFKEKPQETDEEREAREKKEEEERKKKDDEEPPTRRSAKDFIIERKEKKIKKLKEKIEDGGEGGEGGEEVTPEGKTAIRKEVERITEPILRGVTAQADEQELKDLFANPDYPDAKKMEKQIRKYMKHSAYKDASVEFIYLGLAAKEMKLQEKKDKADEEAKKGRLGGHPRGGRKLTPLPDVRDLSDKEFDELLIKVKTGQT